MAFWELVHSICRQRLLQLKDVMWVLPVATAEEDIAEGLDSAVIWDPEFKRFFFVPS